jgi:hypothetical protein
MTNPPQKPVPGLTPLPESLPRLPPLPYETQSSSTSSEASLSRWSGFLVVLAWVLLLPTAVALVLVFRGSGAERQIGIVAGLTSLASSFGCFISAALLRGMANIIRLLKMSNRVPFDGELD